MTWVADRLGNLKGMVKYRFIFYFFQPFYDLISGIVQVSETYNHFDFLAAPDVNQVVNYPLLELIPPP